MPELLTHTQWMASARSSWTTAASTRSARRCSRSCTALSTPRRRLRRLLVLTGREGFLTAGFDLKLEPEKFGDAVGRGGALALKLAEHPRPVLIASTGHAIAMGSLLLLAADFRIGIDGEFRYGLNEAMIGLTLPKFAVALGDHRLSPNYHDRAMLLGEFFGPAEARQAGFLDRVVTADELDDSVAQTVELLAAVKPEAHRGTKALARRELLQRLHAAIDSGSGFDW